MTMGIGNNAANNVDKNGKPDPDKGKGGIGNNAWSNRKANQDKPSGKGK